MTHEPRRSAFRDWQAALLVILGVLLLNLRLRSRYNTLTPDQDFWLSATYPLVGNLLATPTNVVMSQAYPSFAKILEHPPLYFMVSAIVFRLVGFSVLGVGVLHVACRVASTLAFYFLSRRLGHDIGVSLALAALWATSVAVVFQRPEDLGLVFLVLAVFLFVPSGGALRWGRLVGVGALVGLALLCHSSFLYLSFATFGFLVLTYRRLVKPAHLLVFAVAVAVTWSYWWLFYVWPNWDAFRITFFDYAVKHSQGQAGDYSPEYLRYLATGADGGPAPRFVYSAIPLVALFAAAYEDFWQRQPAWVPRLAPLAALLVLALLVHGHRVHPQLVVFFKGLLLLLTAFLLGDAVFRDRRRRWVFGLVAAAASLQASVAVAYSALSFAGNAAAGRSCYAGLDEQIRALRPPIGEGEKIIADISLPPETWLNLLPSNPIYRYMALTGHTKGGLAIASHYDDSFKWLLLSSDIEHSRPYWADASDAATKPYFLRHYTLVRVLKIQGPCLGRGLARFGSARNDVYLYAYRPSGGAEGATGSASAAEQAPGSRS